MNPCTALFDHPGKGRRRHVRLVLVRLEGRDLPSGVTLVPNVGADPIPQIAPAEYVQDNNIVEDAPAGQLGALVQKWFYSANLPEMNIEGVLYKPVTGSLVGPNVPQSSDVVEKAYAQLAEEGWSQTDSSSNDGVNSYASIAVGDNRVAGRQIMGNVHAAWLSILDGTVAEASQTMATLATDLQKGDLLTICTADRR